MEVLLEVSRGGGMLTLPQCRSAGRGTDIATALRAPSHLRGPGRAPAAGPDLLAGKDLARALLRALGPLIERAVCAGAAGCGVARPGGILDVLHGLRFGR